MLCIRAKSHSGKKSCVKAYLMCLRGRKVRSEESQEIDENNGIVGGISEAENKHTE